MISSKPEPEQRRTLLPLDVFFFFNHKNISLRSYWPCVSFVSSCSSFLAFLPNQPLKKPPPCFCPGAPFFSTTFCPDLITWTTTSGGQVTWFKFSSCLKTAMSILPPSAPAVGPGWCWRHPELSPVPESEQTRVSESKVKHSPLIIELTPKTLSLWVIVILKCLGQKDFI